MSDGDENYGEQRRETNGLLGAGSYFILEDQGKSHGEGDVWAETWKSWQWVVWVQKKPSRMKSAKSFARKHAWQLEEGKKAATGHYTGYLIFFG